MGLDVNSEPDTDWLRYGYTSLTTPQTTYELNTKTGERKLLKRQPVIGYDPDKYVTERLWATARDGTKVPVSVVYKKGFEKDGKAALLQYAYGSYGSSTDPNFNLPVVSLLDRGMVYAIAHIRGGQEMGRAWYDDGKLLHKKNTFTDFIDVTDFLVKQGYAAKDRVAAHGGSAGGLLMGAIANMAPDNYRVILSQVPFVDVVTTMLDASIPLTTNEYDEWGNPEQKAVLRLHAVVLALRQPQGAGLSGDVRRHRAVGFAGAVLRAGQVRRAPARPEHRRRCRCCSAPTWMPATAASPAASAAIANWRRCMRSCSTSWPCPKRRPRNEPALYSRHEHMPDKTIAAVASSPPRCWPRWPPAATRVRW